ncbi:MAG: heme-degrading protein [Pedosphaera sp.]|jgi:uncharacterized protein (UPF0303 family)|nr:heme-degrading protein [Pedosphaera sp.]
MELTRDLEIVARQEQELVLPRFDMAMAWQLGVHLRELAVARKLAVVIDVRRFDQALFYTALPGTSPNNANWVRRKSNVVAHLHKSSYAVGLELKLANTNLTEKYALPAAEYASHGGAFPLVVADAGIVGCVTVSGLPQRLDHELVVEALCGHLGRDYHSLALPQSAG